MADGFQVQESNAKIEPQAPTTTIYDTDEIVSGSRGSGNHKNTVSVLGSSAEMRVAALAASKTDAYYGSTKTVDGYECRPLHGVYNYVANLHFLYEAAKGATSTQPSNKDK